MGTRTRNFANNILSGGTIDGTDFLSGAVAAPNIANSSAVNVDSIPSISNVISPVAGDPPSPALGDIWYNSVAKKLRYEGLGLASFATGGNSSNSYYSRSGYGTQTAGLQSGGTTGGGVVYNNTEEYNGASWTAGGNLPTSKSSAAAAGTQTAGMSIGGFLSPGPTATNQTLEYNGTAWTSLNNLASNFYSGSGNGSTAAAIITNGSIDQDNVQKYDGTSWSADTNAPFSKTSLSGAGVGSSDDYLVAGGTVPATPAIVATSHSYDGTTWTATNNLVNARENPYQFGTTSSALSAGGNQTVGAGDGQTDTQLWNGTSWAVDVSLSTSRSGGARGGTTTAGLVCGGYPGGQPNAIATEEYTGAAPLTKNFSND